MIWIPSLIVLVDQEPNPVGALRMALGYTKRNAAQLAGLLAISLGVLAASIIPARTGSAFGDSVRPVAVHGGLLARSRSPAMNPQRAKRGAKGDC